MKIMIQKHKGKILVSSLIILIPILFGILNWNKLPDTMLMHWNTSGNADRAGSKAFVIFGLPVTILIGHYFCLAITFLDKKQQQQNAKALGMVFWILPVISLVMNGFTYQAALGKEVNSLLLVPALLGILFIVMGNYLPKVKQNRTLGIKISWTINNEENWNKTHRFAGKIWVIGGIIILFSALLPPNAMIWVMLCAAVIVSVIPILFSYRIYRSHQEEGISYVSPPKSSAEKIGIKITIGIVSLLFAGIAVLMFTGEIDVLCEDSSLKINASYWPDLEVPYIDIDAVEYRNSLNTGLRANGFGSGKLAMGTFENDEFGSYTLYAYRNALNYIVLTSEDNILVIGMNNTEETQALYNTLLEKIAD